VGTNTGTVIYENFEKTPKTLEYVQKVHTEWDGMSSKSKYSLKGFEV